MAAHGAVAATASSMSGIIAAWSPSGATATEATAFGAKVPPAAAYWAREAAPGDVSTAYRCADAAAAASAADIPPRIPVRWAGPVASAGTKDGAAGAVWFTSCAGGGARRSAKLSLRYASCGMAPAKSSRESSG